jgi:hypothetical protein
LLLFNQILLYHPIQENLCLPFITYPHRVILYTVVAGPSFLILLRRVNGGQEYQTVFYLFLFVQLLPQAVLLSLYLGVKGYYSLAEGVFQVDVFGHFLDLRDLLLSRLLRHEVDLENYVVSVLGFYH